MIKILLKSMKNLKLQFLALLIIFSINPLYADYRVNGVANFLVDKADANYTYIVQQKLLNNEYLSCYLPNTYNALSIAGFNNLISMNQKTWETNVERDLNGLLVLLLYSQLSSDDLETFLFDFRENYLELVSAIEVKAPDGTIIPISFIPLNATKAQRDFVNSFYGDALDAMERLDSLATSVKIIEKSSCISDHQVFSSFRDQLADIDSVFNNITQQTEVLFKSDIYVDGIKVDAKSLSLVLSLAAFIELTDFDLERLKELEDLDDLVSIVIFVLDKMQKLGESNDLKLVSSKGFNEFKSFAMLAAQMSEADSEEQVKAILDSYFLGDVSFGVKREQSKTATIQSYFSLSLLQDANGNFIASPSVPIGFEYTLAKHRRPFSLFIGVLDFAGPVKTIASGNEATASWEQLIAPSAAISVGLKDLPVAFYVGYDVVSEGVEMGVSLDLPLKRLF